MSFLEDLVFPDELLVGETSGTRDWSTRSNETPGRVQSRTSLVSQPQRLYETGLIPRPQPEYMLIWAIHDVAGGSARGFRLRDPIDNSVSGTQGVLQAVQPTTRTPIAQAGIGWGVPHYQLSKAYTVQGYSHIRQILKPVAGLAITRAAAAVTIGASAGNASLDLTTGRVVFVADSQANVTGVTPGATTVITLNTALSPALVVGDRLWLQGLTGAGAVLLNDLSHEVTNVAGAVYTIATTTTGATINAAGTGRRYPQPSQSLLWAGAFHVPVHFRDDSIPWRIRAGGPDDSRLIDCPSILLEELINP